MEVHSDCIVSTSIYNVYSRLSVPKLFKLADTGRWDKIPRRALKHPSEAKFVFKYAPADTALHRLVRPLHGSPSQQQQPHEEELAPTNAAENPSQEYDSCVTEMLLEAVRAILRANPAATCNVNMFGQGPLHLAVQDEPTLCRCAAAFLLLKHSPRAAAIRDSKGQTPLHYLVQSKKPTTPDVQSAVLQLVETLACSRRDVLTVADSKGQTAIDLAEKAGNQLYADILTKVHEGTKHM